MVRISSTEKGGGIFLKLCNFKGKCLSPSFLDCSLLSLEQRERESKGLLRSPGCPKDPSGKGQQPRGWESSYGRPWADRHGRPSTGTALSAPRVSLPAAAESHFSTTLFHSVSIPKKQNIQAKDIYLDRLQLEETAMPADMWRLGSGNMLALGLANSSFLHLWFWQPSLHCFSETANDFGRCFQLYNIKSLFVKLRGAVPRNHLQRIFFLSPYIWTDSVACQKTYRELRSWEQSPFWECLPASKYWDWQPHCSLWHYEVSISSFGMHGPSNWWDAGAKASSPESTVSELPENLNLGQMIDFQYKKK